MHQQCHVANDSLVEGIMEANSHPIRDMADRVSPELPTGHVRNYLHNPYISDISRQYGNLTVRMRSIAFP